MPALDMRSSVAWLQLNEPALAALSPAVGVVEQGPPVERSLDDLGKALDAALSEHPAALSARLRDPTVTRRLATLLDELGPARRYRLLAWLASPTLPDHHAIISAIFDSPDHSPRLRTAMNGSNRLAHAVSASVETLLRSLEGHNGGEHRNDDGG